MNENEKKSAPAITDTDEKVEICIKQDVSHGKNGFCWAWRESADKNILGWVPTLDEVKRSASRMFQDKTLFFTIL